MISLEMSMIVMKISGRNTGKKNRV